MFRTLSFASLLALPLATGCVVVDNDDDTDSGSATDSTSATTTASTSATTSATSATDSGTMSASGSSSDTGTSTGTAGGTACGWGDTGIADPAEGYVCGGNGEDPGGTYPMACPSGTSEGDDCGTITGVGCCDPSGDVFYCNTNMTITREAC